MHCTLKALSNENRTCIYNELYAESTIQLKPYMYLQCTVRWKQYPIKTVHEFTSHCIRTILMWMYMYFFIQYKLYPRFHCTLIKLYNVSTAIVHNVHVFTVYTDRTI